uniref:Uncharacterized protein n=1 Tax=Romanomermis culicivorax TaxID=13658 RepID=A0A915KX27_ROMCU
MKKNGLINIEILLIAEHRRYANDIASDFAAFFLPLASRVAVAAFNCAGILIRPSRGRQIQTGHCLDTRRKEAYLCNAGWTN